MYNDLFYVFILCGMFCGLSVLISLSGYAVLKLLAMKVLIKVVFEPVHDKTIRSHVYTAKTQIS